MRRSRCSTNAGEGASDCGSPRAVCATAGPWRPPRHSRRSYASLGLAREGGMRPERATPRVGGRNPRQKAPEGAHAAGCRRGAGGRACDAAG